MALLGHLLTDHELPLRFRVAAVIVLLYAQPLSRIVRLTLDDIIYDGDQVMLRLGEPPSPVPTPFAQLLLAWINEQDNMNTATNPHSRWLFPAHRARQPMHPTTLAALIHKLGVPTRTARTAAIRQHPLTMAAAVVADAPSYHPVTTAKIATQIGITWNRHAPTDHTRTENWLNTRAHQSPTRTGGLNAVGAGAGEMGRARRAVRRRRGERTAVGNPLPSREIWRRRCTTAAQLDRGAVARAV